MVLIELSRHSEALAHLDRARSIFVSLKESGRVAEVNETRAQAFIAQGSYPEAERAAFAAVSTFERGDERSLLAASLNTHGIALARQGKTEAARPVFRRAVKVADNAGNLVSAGNAYLLMIEELSLAAIEAGTFFLEADNRLGDEVDNDSLKRLRRCARIIANGALGKRGESIDELLIGGPLEAEMHHVEAGLNKRALDQANGSVTRAAKLLGITHQGLDWTLRNRRKQLLDSRSPRRRRRKSIIKSGSPSSKRLFNPKKHLTPCMQ